MSKENCWQALNMEAPAKVPRTEYSAHDYHWDLMKNVTGIDTDILENRSQAQTEFVKAWDYGWMWGTMVHRHYMTENGGRVADMGHAEFGESADGEGSFHDAVQNPFADIEEVYKLDACKEYKDFGEDELIKRFTAHYNGQVEKYPNCLNMSGTYSTMFSGLIDIFGWDSLLVAMAMDENRFAKVIEGYYEWVKQFFNAYAKTDIPVMMVHDDLCWTSGPVTDPDWYRKHIFPYLRRLLEPVQAAGKKIYFTSDGNIDCFIDDFVDLGIDSLVMEPCTNLDVFAKKHGQKCGFVGGLDCRTLTMGTKADIKKEMERVMAWKDTCPGFVLAVGNHIPADVPIENALYYNELYEQMAYR